MSILQDNLASYKNAILVLSTLAVTTTTLLLLILIRLAQILPPPLVSQSANNADLELKSRPPPSVRNPTHLLVVLGSGGHTAEMLNILTTLPNFTMQFTQRTYVVSSGDSFSASKAVEFEKHQQQQNQQPMEGVEDQMGGIYSITTVRRARRVHQSFLTTPISTLLSLYDCIAVLRGTHPDLPSNGIATIHPYPDLILTNGPGTGVCVVLAALLLRFFGFSPSPLPPNPVTGQFQSTGEREEEIYMGQGQMRTIFIESWARVKTLSLSGKILRPLVNRFLVQWPQLAEIQGQGVEYLGPLVS